MNSNFDDDDTSGDDYLEGWKRRVEGSTPPVQNQNFDEESNAEEAVGQNKKEVAQQNKQNQQQKVLFDDQSLTERGVFDHDKNSFLKPRFHSVSFSSNGIDGLFDQEEVKENADRKQIFLTDERETPEIRTRRLFDEEEENSFDSQDSFYAGYIMKFEELGLQVKSSDIRKTIRQLPEGTTKDIVIETIIQKYYDGNFSDEEDIAITPLNPSPKYNSPMKPPSFEPRRDEIRFFCYGCYESRPGEAGAHRIWDCFHAQCVDCLQKNISRSTR